MTSHRPRDPPISPPTKDPPINQPTIGSQPPGDLVDLIRRGRRFVVASHQRPDGDAIGSAMAMALTLRAIGKDATVVADAIPPAFLQPFPEVASVRITPEITDTFDAALIMECSELTRTGVAGLDRSPVINIDHHPGNKRYGVINWIDESAAACGEMVFTLIETLGVPLTSAIATHVYLAVLTDTGSFHFSHLSPRTFEVARRCVEAGADPRWIARTHYDSSSLSRVRIFGAVMNGMVIVGEGRVALLSITRQTMNDLGGTNDDLEGLINFPLTVKDIEAVAFFKEVGDNDWRVSMRSKGAVDIGAIARQFTGGGHTNAAGCSAKGTLDDVNKQFGRLMTEAITAK